jgi:hypothetical protein
MASKSSRNKKKKQKAALQESLELLKEQGNAAFNAVSHHWGWMYLGLLRQIMKRGVACCSAVNFVCPNHDHANRQLLCPPFF